ncbi:MAG TPA: hypothetical protein VGA37_03525 [Gemmatimonadales bacterium]|jgi:hypothetical protein
MDPAISRGSGDTPWQKDELMAGFQYAVELRNTPRDDWDRAPRRFSA